jgi:hypothetical protein
MNDLEKAKKIIKYMKELDINPIELSLNCLRNYLLNKKTNSIKFEDKEGIGKFEYNLKQSFKIGDDIEDIIKETKEE